MSFQKYTFMGENRRSRGLGKFPAGSRLLERSSLVSSVSRKTAPLVIILYSGVALHWWHRIWRVQRRKVAPSSPQASQAPFEKLIRVLSSVTGTGALQGGPIKSSRAHVCTSRNCCTANSPLECFPGLRHSLC